MQPQYPSGEALCLDCWTVQNAKYREERKQALAAAPRCEAPGCKARGAWKTTGVLLCRRHLRAVEAAWYGGRAGYVWLPADPLTREEVLRMAVGKVIP